jgi:membrane protein YdbS with pleckstrin-like domain
VEAPETAATCRQCGAELPVGSAFCNRCGASQSETAERPAQPFAAPPSPAPPPPEATIWTGRYALKSVAHVWLLWFAWIVGVLLVYWRFVGKWPDARNWQILAAVALVPGLWPLGRALYAKLTLRYRLTNHRLFTESGLLARQHDELELIRVDDVSVHQNVVQRVFDVGTVMVVSTDSSSPRLSIRGVEHPIELKERIRGEVRARRARTTFLESL